MAERKHASEEASPTAAFEDTTVRLVYDMYHKLADLVEQMQDLDDGPDDEERAKLHDAEDALVGRAVA